MASDVAEELVPIFVLREPEFNDFDYDAYVKMQMISAARAEVGIFDGAPYGYYLVTDSKGERKILAYLDGPDVQTALSHALEEDQAAGVSSDSTASRDYRSSSRNTAGTPTPGRWSQPAVSPRAATVTFENHSLSTIDVRAPTNVPRTSRITQVDKNSLMPVPERGTERSLYCVSMTLDPTEYPDCRGMDYLLPVDTADTSVWLLCDDFRCIKTPGSAPGPWPSSGYRAWEVRRTVPLPEGRPAFNFDRTPEHTKNETMVHYADGGVVYVRAYPEDHVLVEVPCWDWRHGRASSICFPLPCVLAYAANQKLASQPYDGNLGLAIHGTGGVLYSYSEALAKARHVWTHSVFLVRFLHPDAVRLATSPLVRSFVSFSKHFPCTPAVNFSRAIYFPPSESDGRHCKWGLRVEGLALLVPGRTGYERINIDAIEGLPGTDYFDATLDSASGTSLLPTAVVSEIQAKWLLNNPAINNGNAYCGPERTLGSCDIVFTFRSVKDNERVELRCNAARFLRSNVRLPPHRLGALNPPPAATELQRYRACPLTPTSGRYILGINFYWTAFVEHWGPAMGGADIGREPPYIRLAPQMITERGRVTCDDYEFILPQGVVPRNTA